MKATSKLLPLLILIHCSLLSCKKSGSYGWGASGAIEHIKVKDLDEKLVNEKLVEWSEANGFKKSEETWEEVTGSSDTRNNKGDIVYPVTFVRGFEGGDGYYALGIAAPTESHEYITVFSKVEFQAQDEAVSDAAQEDFNQLEKDFHAFVESELPILSSQ